MPHALVVDDDHDTANSLARLIGELGYEARAAYDGEAAVEQAASFLPDMALIERYAVDRIEGAYLDPARPDWFPVKPIY